MMGTGHKTDIHIVIDGAIDDDVDTNYKGSFMAKLILLCSEYGLDYEEME